MVGYSFLKMFETLNVGNKTVRATTRTGHKISCNFIGCTTTNVQNKKFVSLEDYVDLGKITVKKVLEVIINKNYIIPVFGYKTASIDTCLQDCVTFTYYHRFPLYVTLENKTSAETFLKFPSVLGVIDRLDRNPPITATATSVTFTPSLHHAKRTVIGEFRSVDDMYD